MLLRSTAILPLLVIFFTILQLSLPSCIGRLSVDQISSTRATLSWYSLCNRHHFRVSWRHRQYQACGHGHGGGSDPAGILTKIVSNTTKVEIENLQPYSSYNFTVKDIPSHQEDPPSYQSVIASTEESIPQVSPWPVLDCSLDTADSLLFRWDVPGMSQCADYQARLGYLFFKLVGVDSWNAGYLKEDNLSISNTQLNISGLQEDSTYEFYLFVTNMYGEFDEDIFMKMHKKTKSSMGISGVITLAITSVFFMALLVLLLVFATLSWSRGRRQYLFKSLKIENPMEVAGSEEFGSISCKD